MCDCVVCCVVGLVGGVGWLEMFVFCWLLGVIGDDVFGMCF